MLPVPISLGALQKGLDRVAQALEPHDRAMARPARPAPVNDSAATPWWLTRTWQWLWGMARATVACDRLHPHRSKEACAALPDDGAGIVGRDGEGVDQTWGAHRQTGLAHLSRPARGGAERQSPALAAGGGWALAERRRLCHRAPAPPPGGAGLVRATLPGERAVSRPRR